MARKAIRTIVTRISRGDHPEEFVVEVVVDGSTKSFRVTVVLPGMYSVRPDSQDYFDTFRFRKAGKNVARLVIDVYKGNPVDLPFDLGER